MRAADIVWHLCSKVAPLIDRRRVVLLGIVVDALVRGGRLGLTALGRALSSAAAPKHRIKRVDRLLGNIHAQQEIVVWFATLAKRLLRKKRRPIILIDWTQTVGNCHALVAAVAFRGRALPIYLEVHREKKLANRKVHRSFLHQLRTILPDGSKPVVVADAGFKTPFFVECQNLGWDFVIRLRGRCKLRQWLPRRFLSFKEVFAVAGQWARDLGVWTPYSTQVHFHSRVILGPKPAAATHRRRKPNYEQRRALEPWLLATTLKTETPSRIISIYAQRMQIEETFRDTKNHRFGWAFDLARSNDPNRQAVLLLVACLAFAALLLAGDAAEQLGYAPRHQANTVRTRRVLSLIRLGALALAPDQPSIPVRKISKCRLLLEYYVEQPRQLRLLLTRFFRGKWR